MIALVVVASLLAGSGECGGAPPAPCAKIHARTALTPCLLMPAATAKVVNVQWRLFPESHTLTVCKGDVVNFRWLGTHNINFAQATSPTKAGEWAGRPPGAAGLDVHGRASRGAGQAPSGAMRARTQAASQHPPWRPTRAASGPPGQRSCGGAKATGRRSASSGASAVPDAALRQTPFSLGSRRGVAASSPPAPRPHPPSVPGRPAGHAWQLTLLPPFLPPVQPSARPRARSWPARPRRASLGPPPTPSQGFTPSCAASPATAPCTSTGWWCACAPAKQRASAPVQQGRGGGASCKGWRGACLLVPPPAARPTAPAWQPPPPLLRRSRAALRTPCQHAA